MSGEFPSASSMRSRKSISVEVLDEICAIKRAVLIANDACNLEVCIEDTLMTTAGDSASELYYQVWKDLEEDRTKELWMNEVINCFEGSGYTINRVTNCDTSNTFKWCLWW